MMSPVPGCTSGPETPEVVATFALNGPLVIDDGMYGVRVEIGTPEVELVAKDGDADVAGNTWVENESAMPEPTKITTIITTATDGSAAR